LGHDPFQTAIPILVVRGRSEIDSRSRFLFFTTEFENKRNIKHQDDHGKSRAKLIDEIRPGASVA
jgi:hypothetical protein